MTTVPMTTVPMTTVPMTTVPKTLVPTMTTMLPARDLVALRGVMAGLGLVLLFASAQAAGAPVETLPGPAEGTIRLSREPERSYRSLSLALDAAQDGDIVEVGAGAFAGPLSIAGKSIEIRGAGADRTQITAPSTVVHVAADARALLVSLAVESKGGPAFAPAILALGDGFRLEECVVRGAAGFGVEIRSAGRDVELYGNTIRGNSGGGVRFTSAVGRLHSNVITDNGGPGVLIDGEPPTVAVVRVEHNTLVRNGAAAGAPVAATGPGGPDAALPEVLQHRLVFSWNIASGRLAEKLLTRESLSDLQAHNVLVWPDNVADLFESADEGDYRPDDALPTDPGGLELGARLSEDAQDRLDPSVDAALARGRFADALALARRAPADQKDALWERIRSTLYARYAQYVEAKRPGLAVRDFFLALPNAPRGWNVGDRFQQALARSRGPYAQGIDWSGAFPDTPTLRRVLLELVTEAGLLPARSAATGEGGSWSVVARASKQLLLDRHAEPLGRKLTLANPEYRDVAQTLEIERSRRKRLDEQRRKVAEELEAYEARHGAGSTAAYVRARRGELDKRSQAVVNAELGIRELEKTLAQVPETYTVEVQGQLERTEAMAEITLKLTDPVGRTYEEVLPFHREETFLSLAPIPMLGFEGIAPRPVVDDRERARYGRDLVEKTLVVAVNVIEKRDLDRVAALALAVRDQSATEDDWNELFSLLVVYADRFLEAVSGERPAAELREARDRYPDIEQPRFQLTYDATLSRKPPLRFVAETNAARRQAERLLDDLEGRHRACWAVLPELRSLFDRLGGRPFEEFLRMVRSFSGGGT